MNTLVTPVRLALFACLITFCCMDAKADSITCYGSHGYGGCQQQANPVATSPIRYWREELRDEESLHVEEGMERSRLNGLDSSHVRISGGDVSWLELKDNAAAEIEGGEVSWVNAYDDSTVDVSGGDISWLIGYDQSTIRVSGIEELSWLKLYGNAEADLYVRHATFQDGHLSGVWASGQAFDIWAVRGDHPQYGTTLPAGFHLHQVPEPSTMASLSLLLGTAAIRRRFRK